MLFNAFLCIQLILKGLENNMIIRYSLQKVLFAYMPFAQYNSSLTYQHHSITSMSLLNKCQITSISTKMPFETLKGRNETIFLRLADLLL